MTWSSSFQERDVDEERPVAEVAEGGGGEQRPLETVGLPAPS